MAEPEEVDVTTAAALHRDGALLLDVREAYEVAICSIPGSRHLPMRQIPQALATLPRDEKILVLCHHGGRSQQVTRFLRAQGCGGAINVAGGIEAWACEIAPGLARY